MHSCADDDGNVDLVRGAGEIPAVKQTACIELCAGSAVRGAAAQKHGYGVMLVDCKRNRYEPRCKPFL